jgi:transcriptional regulator with XRE-family HTH domain
MFKSLRKAKGFTQVDVAEHLNMKQSTISNWENGISKPDVPTVAKLAKLFGCDVSEVVACFADVAEE